MSTAKSSLRAAKAALDAKKYNEAANAARKVIEEDPSSYHGHVFLGLALEKQSESEASEAAYKSAINFKDKDTLAWQGLVSLYEKQASKKLDQYHDAALRLAIMYMEGGDKIKCQSVIDKYVEDAKKYGSRSQIKHSLEALLPNSAIYYYLEGQIPEPAHTYIRIADITEAEEKERVNSEIGQRRTRLGARIEQVTTEVKREVLESSRLEGLYAGIINWTQDDEIRRQYEERLLQHAGDTLAALPQSKKVPKREEVMGMARGLVILKHPFLLAWKIVIEWSDLEDIGDLDPELLRDFVALFPNEGLSKVVRGFLESEITPFPIYKTKSGKGSGEDGGDGTMPAEDRLILMTEGLGDDPKSILAHRIMARYYLYLDEFESAVHTARNGLRRVTAESTLTGLDFRRIQDVMNTLLASALIQYQAPRHHGEARTIFEDILSRKPSEVSALMGVGMIFEEQGNYTEALSFLTRALTRSNDPKIKAEVAWCKAMNNHHEVALQELNACLTEMEGSDSRARSLRSQTLHRIGICLWSLDNSRSARKDRNGAYARFLSSLQADINYAPAYTSLGIYYADYSKDKKRARKCFQKAFELSASEVEAANRLAQSFAQSGEWDLVEVVSQRVIESGKTRSAPGSKKPAISWPYAALGVVQLSNQEYSKSIVSFQTALRTSPGDYHCWVGLGESYHNSGRYVAATKAFEHAQKLETASLAESSWFSEYMLANVRQELGEYDEAIKGYQTVLAARPKEYGVSLALLQTYVDSAWHSVGLGFFGQAADSAREAIRLARCIAEIYNDSFSLWKAVGDASSIFSIVQEYNSMLLREPLQHLLETGAEPVTFEVLADVDQIDWKSLQQLSMNDDSGMRTSASITAAILAQKRAVRAAASDLHAQAVAWYNLGWAEHRAFAVVGKEQPASRTSGYLKAAVQCFKQAIELEAGNAEFWNSLGIVTCDLSPKISQHAFVRSLYINDKNARVWANLGAFYLLQDERQLANEAFTRAQSTDPDYAQAWLGQGLLAARLSDDLEARQLFTHAYEIADSSNSLIKSQYSTTTFDHVHSSFSDESNNLQALLALHQLRSQKPSDNVLRHLSSLFAERAGNFDDAVSTLELVCTQLEAEYETSESQVALTRFAQAKSDLARMHLANSDFQLAADKATTALDLTADDGAEENCPPLRLSAHMTAGLAFYFQKLTEQSIEMFESALSETDGHPDIICLLAQVLWAKGGENEREVAREQLLDCIEKYPGQLSATMLLGSIALLNDDQDTIEAVRVDLESLRSNDGLSTRDQGRIVKLLGAISAICPGPEGEEASKMNEANVSIMLAPAKPHGWSQLAGLTGESFPAEVAVFTAIKASPPRGNLNSEDVCIAYASTGCLDDAQKAIMMAPSRPEGWVTLDLNNLVR